jgi:hypothetical protein
MPSLDWEWKDVDLGSLPAWLGAFSLLLAYRIFRIDRTNAERAQVDLIGAWATPTYDRRWLKETAEGRNVGGQEVSVQPYIRNASELPVEIRTLAYEIHTTWLVQTDGGMAYEPVDGSPVVKQFLYDVGVAPQQTWDNAGTASPANVAHTAPEGGLQLSIVRGVWCEVSWLLVVDNAGRRWELRPAKGRRARRIRWYHRPREYQPGDWFSPLMRRFTVKRS